jgi:hypothetical protein
MAAFDALNRESADRVKLWQQVVDAERVLDDELRQRVKGAIEMAAKDKR